MNPTGKKHMVESLFVLIIFSVFMITALMLVMIGANVYRGVVQDTKRNNTLRASFSYIANKVRSADSAGGVHIINMGTMDALTIDADYGGDSYRTYIYCHDGYIKELFAFKDEAFTPETGEKIIEANQFRLKKTGSLLTFEAAGQNEPPMCLSVHLNS